MTAATRRSMTGRGAWVALLVCMVPAGAAGADLAQETVAAYERYIADIEQQFAMPGEGDGWLADATPETLARLRTGEIISRPGYEDGILDAPRGLIHHWRGAAFIPDITLRDVLAVAQNYPAYADMYEWVVGSHIIHHEREAGRDKYRLLLRISRTASVVTSVVDVWSHVEYRYKGDDRATAVSHADCVRQVEEAGKSNERVLPVGEGSGYLWRANTYSAYLERDGGVYVDLQTVGLSRKFPRMLGWLIEPIARRLGRGSAAESLNHLREAVVLPRQVADRHENASPQTSWCGV